ncbi:MAG: site-2 protease family protein, partial [Bacteroidales bacterium]|nr:site-2 protease family protein [Bacteroidales bacterium]
MKILQVVLALSTLIVIHEFGHFSFAKLFGIRVDKFFLFFDAGGVKLLSTKEGWFSRLFPKLKNSETEYGIGWLPLGGYCKICGMVDESMDTDFLETEPKEYEFRSKKAWQRLLVMAGGVLYNFIFAILAFILIMGIWGESYLSNSENSIYVNELSYEMGFRNGDRILMMDDFVPENFSMLQADLARKSVKKVTVLRDADTVDIYIDQAMMPQILNTPDLFSVAVPFVVDTIPPASPNYGMGFMRDDRIISVDGKEIEFVQDSREILSGRKGAEVPVRLVRNADTLEMAMKVDTLGRALIYAQVPGLMTKE